jgi:hypothetical protein
MMMKQPQHWTILEILLLLVLRFVIAAVVCAEWHDDWMSISNDAEWWWWWRKKNWPCKEEIPSSVMVVVLRVHSLSHRQQLWVY